MPSRLLFPPPGWDVAAAAAAAAAWGCCNAASSPGSNRTCLCRVQALLVTTVQRKLAAVLLDLNSTEAVAF